jgi:hypothetical protein
MMSASFAGLCEDRVIGADQQAIGFIRQSAQEKNHFPFALHYYALASRFY